MTRPSATYRLQLRGSMTFDRTAKLARYLAELGVSHVYLSPCLQARPGSVHGYDVVDPTRVDDTLGGDEGLARLSDALDQHGLGLVLDIVPNHLALDSAHNPWWWDLLRLGPESRYARHFDVTWRPGPAGQSQVLVPELARPLLDEIVDGEDLRLTVGGDGELRVVYHHHAWPLRPGSLDAIGLGDAGPEEAVAAVEADRGRLLSVLMQQHYRLVHWRRATAELDHRRFFDISLLGGVRVEDPEVFEDTHRRVLDLVEDGTVDGLRIDHPDGLRDPLAYLRRLRESAPDTWIVVEKILEPGERPRTGWPVDGTVGYAFADLALGLFLDPVSEPVLADLNAAVTGDRRSYHEVVESSKRQVVEELFEAEVSGLLDRLERIADRTGVVCERDDLRTALYELLIVHPVYRTYVRPEDGDASPEDRRVLTGALARVRARHPELDQVLELLGELLTLREWSAGEAAVEFVARFQQLTGPVMAKGVEDTAFYRYVKFVAANEVGGDPGRLGTPLGTFHSANVARQSRWPTTMLTTSTHDTKRSEDVRARLAVVTERTDDWVRAVTEWREFAAAHRGKHGPSPSLEYLTFQTLVGAWPIPPDRLVAYLRKAAREQKHETHWLRIDERYEADVEAFARGLLDDAEFTASVERFVELIREPGWLTALSQTLLKLTCPGVPDVYQGCELWDLSLVDPDNRRPVDFDRRAELLAESLADGPEPEEILARMDTGLPKLWVTNHALTLRRERPAAFGPEGSYQPLYAAGDRAEHVVAFLRGGEVLPVAPRLVASLGDTFLAWHWGDTALPVPAGRWRDVLADTVHDVGDEPVPLDLLLNRFPVALLVRETG